MPVSWYLPSLEFSLWPCAILLLVFIPVTIWHERNWRRTLADYARARRDAGATDTDWPPSGLAHTMGVQPILVLVACGLLSVMVLLAAAVALMWPHTPPGFDLPINPYDLPYLWSMVVAGTAAIVAGVAIAIDVWRNPWSRVAALVRRAIYAPPLQRGRLFSQALTVDPDLCAAARAEAEPEPPTPASSASASVAPTPPASTDQPR